MIFSSYEFLFLFLPAALLGWHWVSRLGRPGPAVLWLLACSLFFYAWWQPTDLLLLAAVVLANYFLCLRIAAATGSGRRRWLVVCVVANLLVLGCFKYGPFVVSNLARFDERLPTTLSWVLPLGISFYIFQLIVFAVDVSRGHPTERRLGGFALAVTFFPHLIAGPILHPRKILPQFAHLGRHGLAAAKLAPGISLFLMGLCKKTLVADNLAPWSDAVFDAPSGTVIALLDAWTAALAYTFQIYFDFSGYSDMAIGLGWIFGIRLPLNFNSPYKAESLVDFWRRWHMTLSELLREYVYIPLGGSRHGRWNRSRNLFLTMLVGGVWHGAGWTFIVWGACHGLLLALTHAWRDWCGVPQSSGLIRRAACWAGTFLALVCTWVLFRATTFERAWEMLGAMFGTNGVALPPSYVEVLQQAVGQGAGDVVAAQSRWISFLGVAQWALFAALVLWVRLAPNTQEVMGLVSTPPRRLPVACQWQPNLPWAVALAMGFLASLLCMGEATKFLYFQF